MHRDDEHNEPMDAERANDEKDVPVLKQKIETEINRIKNETSIING